MNGKSRRILLRALVSIFAIYELKYSTLTNEEEDEEEEDDREERLLCIRRVVIANFGEEVLFRLEPTSNARSMKDRSRIRRKGRNYS